MPKTWTQTQNGKVVEYREWTQEQVDLAVKMRRAGSSPREIATALGPSFNRAKVIGKLWRMGVTGPVNAPCRRPLGKPAEPSKPRTFSWEQH